MTNKDKNIIKSKILKCLTEDFKKNQAIFNKKEGWQIFNDTDLEMVMEKVVKGLEFAKEEINNPNISIDENKINLGRKIGHVKGSQFVSDGIYLGQWSAWAIDVFTGLGVKSFATNLGLKGDSPVFVKCKNQLLTIHKIVKQ